MAYHPVLERVIVFGGEDFEDTWELDAVGFAALSPLTRPEGLGNEQMVFDRARGELLLVGATGAASPVETWTFDGIDWRRLSDTGPVGDDFALGFDGGRAVGIVVDSALATWTWDGSTWTEAAAATTPAGALTHQIAYDVGRSVVVYLTGTASWEWNGIDWTAGPSLPRNRTTARVAPLSRGALASPTALALDGRLEGELAGVLVVGGNTADTPQENADLFLRDAQWRELRGRSPEGFLTPASAFDATDGRTLVVGEFGGLARTWTWDGISWEDDNPPVLSLEAGALVEDANDRVSYIARDNKTISWRGDAWRDLTVTGALPSISSGEAIFNGTSLIAFVGTDSLVRFEPQGLNAGEWVNIDVADPRPQTGQTALAWDDARQRIVLFGGVSNCDVNACSTWTFEEGAGWTEHADLSERPPSRFSHGMVYDQLRRRTLVFGGVIGSGEVDGEFLWEWDGVGWGRRLAGPPLRSSPAMSYDPDRGRALVFGGQGATDTWEWDGAALGRPAQIARIGFSFAGVEANDVATRVRVRWDAGGVGFPGGAQVDGATLLVWQSGAWVPKTAHAGGVGAPETLAFETADAAVLRDLFVGNELSLHLAASPAAVNGTGGDVAAGTLDYGGVVSDYLEVEVHYQTGGQP